MRSLAPFEMTAGGRILNLCKILTKLEDRGRILFRRWKRRFWNSGMIIRFSRNLSSVRRRKVITFFMTARRSRPACRTTGISLRAWWKMLCQDIRRWPQGWATLGLGLLIENIVTKRIRFKEQERYRGSVSINSTRCAVQKPNMWRIESTYRLGRCKDMEKSIRLWIWIVWFCPKNLWERLIYEGYRSMYVCPMRNDLSQSESARYRMHLSATVKFELGGWARHFRFAWTTTPWIRRQCCLAIGEDVDYGKFIFRRRMVAEKVNYRRRVENNIYHYILAKDRVEDELVKRGKSLRQPI